MSQFERADEKANAKSVLLLCHRRFEITPNSGSAMFLALLVDVSNKWRQLIPSSLLMKAKDFLSGEILKSSIFHLMLSVKYVSSFVARFMYARRRKSESRSVVTYIPFPSLLN